MRILALSLTLVAGMGLGACNTTPEQSAVIGAVGGAAVGHTVASRGSKTSGALLGAAAGAVAGTLIGQANQRNQCYYADGRGGTYVAPC